MRSRTLLAAWPALMMALPSFAAGGSDKTANDSPAAMASFASRHHSTEQGLSSLRAKRMSWDDIATALALSEKSDEPLSDVLEARGEGMSWKEIADGLGVDLDQVAKIRKDLARAGRKAELDDWKVRREAWGLRDSVKSPEPKEAAPQKASPAQAPASKGAVPGADQESTFP